MRHCKMQKWPMFGTVNRILRTRPVCLLRKPIKGKLFNQLYDDQYNGQPSDEQSQYRADAL